MSIKPIPTLKDKFADGKTPTGSDFVDIFDSYFHKSTKINQSQILGLIDDFATKDELSNATIKFKGYHTTLLKLQSEYPQSDNKKDFFAWVGSPYPGTVYKVFTDRGVWTDTREVPTQEEINLTEYAKTNTTAGIVVRTPDGQIPELDTSGFAQKSDMDKLIEKAGEQILYNTSNVTINNGHYRTASNSLLTSTNWACTIDKLAVPENTEVTYNGGLYGLTAGIIITDKNGLVLQFITAGGATTFKNTLTFTTPQYAAFIYPSWLVNNNYGQTLPFSLIFTRAEDTYNVVLKDEFAPVKEKTDEIDAISETIENKLVVAGKDGQKITYADADFTWTISSYYKSDGTTGTSPNWRRTNTGKDILPNAYVTLKGGWLGQSAGCLVFNASGVIVQFVTSSNSGTSMSDIVEELNFVSHKDANKILISSMIAPKVFTFSAIINTGRDEKYFVTPVAWFNLLIKSILQGTDYNYIGEVTPGTSKPQSPSLNDTYFCVQSGSFWGLSNVIAGMLVFWSGSTWTITQFPELSGGSSGGEIPENTDYDVVIIGGGAGGVASAYALKNSGLRVALIEKDATLGGTHLNAWVNVYAVTPPPPFLKGVVDYLRANGMAKYVDYDYQGNAGSAELIDVDYSNTWLRKQFTGKTEANITLDIEGTANKYKSDLQGTITLLMESTLIAATHEKGYVRSVTYKKSNVDTTITAKYFIDSSADDVLLSMVGGILLQGEENQIFFESEYGFAEPNAPGNSSTIVNCPTLMYRTVVGTEDLSGITAGYANDAQAYFSPDASKIYFNTVSYLGNTGREVITNGEIATYNNMLTKTKQHWKTIKNGAASRFAALNLPSRKYESAAPKLGIRETYRAKCERMLNENHLYVKITSANIKTGSNLDKKIACGNHLADIHGTNNVNVAAINVNRKPYGVPYGVLIPKGVKNLFVASRGSGLTHVGACSFRLIKDVMQLGWAAGHAAKICVNSKLTNTRNVDVELLQNSDNTDFANSVAYIESLMS